MAALEAAAASTNGIWDVFDRAAGVTHWIEKMLESQQDPTELHIGSNEMLAGLFGAEPQVGMHLYDPNQARREDLERARQLVYEASQICQQILAEI